MIQRGGRLRAIERHAESVGVATGRGRDDVMNVIVEQLQIAACAGHVFAHRNVLRAGGLVVSDSEPLDDDVTLAGDVDQPILAARYAEAGASEWWLSGRSSSVNVM